MNDQRKSYGAKDKCSLVQWICIKTAIAFLVRTNWTPMPNTSGSYGRQAGRQADKIRLDFEILKILYRLYYLDFDFVYSSAMLLIVLEVHFSLLFSNKAYFRVYFVVCKICSLLFSCRSLLLVYLMIS